MQFKTAGSEGCEYLILGEGDRDVAFLHYLLEVRNIQKIFRIEAVLGNQKFGSYLDGIKAQGRFRKIKGIVLMSDNDASSDKSFVKIKEQLNEAGFPSPTHPLEFARKADMPTVAVLMMPYPSVAGDNTGCLETLVIPSLDSAHAKHAQCVDELMRCAEVEDWPKKGSRDKAKVRCILSTVWSDDPNHGFTFCLSPEKKLIPLDHAIFDEVATFLSHLPDWFESEVKSWETWKMENAGA